MRSAHREHDLLLPCVKVITPLALVLIITKHITCKHLLCGGCATWPYTDIERPKNVLQLRGVCLCVCKVSPMDCEPHRVSLHTAEQEGHMALQSTYPHSTSDTPWFLEFLLIQQISCI